MMCPVYRAYSSNFGTSLMPMKLNWYKQSPYKRQIVGSNPAMGTNIVLNWSISTSLKLSVNLKRGRTMITYLKGDLFNSPAQVLVNAVNTVGVMGKGVALEFKKRYPAMFKSYQKICDNQTFEVGKLYLWKGPEKWVLLFPTKQHWRNPSKLEYIEAGLKKFAAHAQRLGIESIAFPKLRCGNGGLRWESVQPVMERYLKPLPLQIYIYVDFRVSANRLL